MKKMMFIVFAIIFITSVGVNASSVQKSITIEINKGGHNYNAKFNLYLDKNGNGVYDKNDSKVDIINVEKSIGTSNGLASGTYFIKQISAPKSYSIDKEYYKVVLKKDSLIAENSHSEKTDIIVGGNVLLLNTKDINIDLDVWQNSTDKQALVEKLANPRASLSTSTLDLIENIAIDKLELNDLKEGVNTIKYSATKADARVKMYYTNDDLLNIPTEVAGILTENMYIDIAGIYGVYTDNNDSIDIVSADISEVSTTKGIFNTTLTFSDGFVFNARVAVGYNNPISGEPITITENESKTVSALAKINLYKSQNNNTLNINAIKTPDNGDDSIEIPTTGQSLTTFFTLLMISLGMIITYSLRSRVN